MPLRRRDASPKANVTLSEALNWVAFDNFEGPPMHPEEVAMQIHGEPDNVEALGIVEFQRANASDAAEDDLFAALRDGQVQARGRFSRVYAHDWAENDWREQDYKGHAETRSVMPADFWRREGVDWRKSRAQSPDGEYVDIILDHAAVLSLWPVEEAVPGEPGSERHKEIGREEAGRRRGPKERYSESEFFALCACELAVNDFPETQAGLVRRMSELCAVVWGEDRTPGETWLKEKVGYIYKRRERYEFGRQQIEGEAISDRTEVSEKS